MRVIKIACIAPAANAAGAFICEVLFEMTDAATSAYDALLPKYRAFVDAYRTGRSAAEAARLAGYSEKFARWRGHALLRHDGIRAALAEPVRRRKRGPYADLRPRHRTFLDEYCRTWNGSQAAVAAGYTVFSAARHAHRLLVRDDIRAALAERQERAAAASEAEIKEVIETLTRVLRANMLDYISIDAHGQAQFDLSRLTRDQASVISELKVETRKPSRAGKESPTAEIARLRLHDKLAAADKLLRHLGAVKAKRAAQDGKDGALPPRPPEAGSPTKPLTSHDRAKALLAILARAKAEREGEAPDPEMDLLLQKAGLSV